MQRGGAPIEPIISMFRTIQKLVHYVRTAFGDSDASFGGEDIRMLELQGSGQGNGAGPSIWAMVSSVLFDIIRRKGYGIKLRSAISKRRPDIMNQFLDCPKHTYYRLDGCSPSSHG